MSSQNDAEAQALPDRTQNPAADKVPEGETSKNAAKKAAKAARLAADKANKALNKGIGKAEAKTATSKPAKKKADGPALIGIDVSKDEDFPGWYQQVLTKGELLY
jgi:prolyl-tRNA synthetase